MKKTNVKGIIADKFKLPTGIKASDFDNEKYSGQQLRISSDGELVIVMKSKSLTPAPRIIQKRYEQCIFYDLQTSYGILRYARLCCNAR